MTKPAAFAVLLSFVPWHCQPPPWLELRHRKPALTPSGAATAARRAPNDYLRMEALPDANPPLFVMRGEGRGPGKLVFIHGICGHGLGYAQSFTRSAARHGTLIAPQGDRPCGGTPLSKWSLDIEGLDARIVSAFQTLGFDDPIVDVTVIGYSQGANRAESLARKWPARYTRLILIAGPTKVSPYGLSLRSAVMMAGTLDRQDIMQDSSKAFLAAGRRARYLPLPNARHGAMGDSPETSMGSALDWLYGAGTEPSD